MTIQDLPNPLLLAGIIFLAGMLPLALATMTAFIKISVVLAILRNALLRQPGEPIAKVEQPHPTGRVRYLTSLSQ